MNKVFIYILILSNFNAFAQFSKAKGIYANKSTTSIVSIGDTLYASGERQSIYMSFDGGLTWNNKLDTDAGVITVLSVKKDKIYAACKTNPRFRGNFTVVYIIKSASVIEKINQATPNFKYVRDVFILDDSILLATEKGLFLNNTMQEIKLPKYDTFKNKGRYTKPSFGFIKACRDSFLLSSTSSLVLLDSSLTHSKLLINSKSIIYNSMFADGTYRLNDAICTGDSLLYTNEIGVFSYSFESKKSKYISNMSANSQSKFIKLDNNIYLTTNKGLFSIYNTSNNINEGLPQKGFMIYDFTLLSKRLVLSSNLGFYIHDL